MCINTGGLFTYFFTAPFPSFLRFENVHLLFPHVLKTLKNIRFIRTYICVSSWLRCIGFSRQLPGKN